MKVYFYLVIGALLAGGCVKKNQQVDSPYLDFDSLINTQVDALTKAKATLTKSVLLSGKTDQSVLAMDSTLLAQELDVFRQLDLINKPLYNDAYEISDGEKDSQSNLIIRRYRVKVTAPVPFVTFYYQNDFKEIRKIEAAFREVNSLYATERQMVLEFDKVSNKLLLSKYKLTGGQKMILSDSVLFSIHGTFSFQ
jgi:hypothetical protein